MPVCVTTPSHTDMLAVHTAAGWIGGEVYVRAQMHQGEGPPCRSELTDGQSRKKYLPKDRALESETKASLLRNV